jgi:transposase
MEKIRAVLQLRHGQGSSVRRIAASLGLKRSTVSDYINRAVAAGVGWPLPSDWDEATLHRALFGPPVQTHDRPWPDFAYVHTELRRKSVTLQLLHDEYLESHPDGYQYSQFCAHYRRYRKKLNLSMRHTHRAGEKLFVDYAGQTVDIVDGRTGKVSKAQIFVAVMGASNYAYAEATATQKLHDWVSSHCNAFEFFGAVAELTIPDNLKSAVKKPCYYEPEINPTYEEMARHYGTCVLPTRVRHPKDKAKVEAGVLLVERWILAALRNRTFFSLAELNSAIKALLERLNNRPFKKVPGTRVEMFAKLDRPAMKPLPSDRFEYAIWREAKVSIDYHISVHLGDRRFHYYSVPYTLVGSQTRVRIAIDTVEVFCHGQRVAAHVRDDTINGYSTQSEHMPASHKRYAEWTPSRLLRWAGKTGPSCQALATAILESRPHPEQGFRSCIQLIKLGSQYGTDRLERACKRALSLDMLTTRAVKNMLASNHDRLPEVEQSQALLPLNEPSHIRGSAYYR